MADKVLVVDDDPMVRHIVQEMLLAEGYEVEVLEDGEKVFGRLSTPESGKEFCAMVLDVIMPGMNGFDVLTKLRAQSHTQKLPVLMLTGEDRAEDIMNGYNVGADYYVTKPFTRDQLMLGFKLVVGK